MGKAVKKGKATRKQSHIKNNSLFLVRTERPCLHGHPKRRACQIRLLLHLYGPDISRQNFTEQPVKISYFIMSS